MLKESAKSEQYTSNQERQELMAMKKRAEDDARMAADSFVSNTRSPEEKTAGTSSLELVVELFCQKPKRSDAGSPDGNDGLLIHSVAGTASDDLLEIFLAAEVEALAAKSVRILHDNISWSAKYVNWMNQVL